VAILTIDKPTEFHGEVSVTPVGGGVNLVGLAEADSWSYRDDLLAIRDSRHQIVDRLDIVSVGGHNGAGLGLSVSKLTDGTVIIGSGNDYRGGLT
jgi:hypothetical protein